MADFTIGYGRDDVEPGIVPLVQAVRRAGFVTFSSCEGHDDERPEPSYGSVGFFAHEDRALPVHVKLHGLRERLKCSWVLDAHFVCPRGYHDWGLGWTLENCGLKVLPEGAPPEDYARLTIEAARAHDIPLLVELFAGLTNK